MSVDPTSDAIASVLAPILKAAPKGSPQVPDAVSVIGQVVAAELAPLTQALDAISARLTRLEE